MLSFFSAFALLVAREPDVVVQVIEPKATSVYSQSFRANCDKSSIELRNIGLARPSGASPEILLDDKSIELQGDLTAFLDRDKAVYRFAVQCPVQSEIFEITIYRQSKAPETGAFYDALSFRVTREKRIELIGFEQTDAEGFWF